MERGDDRQAPDKLGDEAELEEVLGLDLAEQIAELVLPLRLDVGPEAQRVLADSALDDLIEPRRTPRRR
jgi:hypothetical protein